MDGPEVDFGRLLRDKGHVLSPYCIDDRTRTVVLIETPPDIDVSVHGAFMFQAQREHAIGLYVIPFAEYHQVLTALDTPTPRLVLLYNVSRCGSTLLCKCFSTIQGCRSLSEPDIFTSIAHIAADAGGSRDEELLVLIRSSMKFLCYIQQHRDPTCVSVCLKFRFQVIYSAELIARALPRAKAVFLYRNTLDVVDSMCTAFYGTGANWWIRALRLDVFYVSYLSTLSRHLPKLAPLMYDTVHFPARSYLCLGAVYPCVMTWLSVMHFGMEAYRRGFIHVVLRYEDIVVQQTQLLHKLCHLLQLDNATYIRRDVQTQTRASSSRRGQQKFVYLHEGEVTHIQKLVAQHGEIGCTNYRIPGTMTLGEDICL
jgi:hypothetical protein